MNSIVLETEKLAFIYFKAPLDIGFQHRTLKSAALMVGIFEYFGSHIFFLVFFNSQLSTLNVSRILVRILLRLRVKLLKQLSLWNINHKTICSRFSTKDIDFKVVFHQFYLGSDFFYNSVTLFWNISSHLSSSVIQKLTNLEPSFKSMIIKCKIWKCKIWKSFL